LTEIDQQFPDYARLLEDLARVLQRIAVFQVIGSIDSDDELGDTQVEGLAASMSPADVQLFYQTALIGRRDLHLAPDPKGGAEMTLLRMLAFRPADVAGVEGSGGGSAAADRSAGKKKSAEMAPREVVTAPAGIPVLREQGKWLEPDWKQLISNLGLAGAVRLLASNCALLRREGNTVFLSLDPRSESMLTRERKDKLAAALSECFSEPLTVDISIGAAAEETPMQEESRIADERIEAAKAALESDPNVKALKNMFDAELKTDSIELINQPQND
jgi:DNA polymerase-3 subunit gamma/tau